MRVRGPTVNVIAKNLGAMLGSQVATWGVSLAMLIAAPRVLGDEAFGQIAFVTVLVGFFELLAMFGTATYLMKSVAREPDRVGQYTANGALLGLVLGVTLAVVAVGLSVALGHDREMVLLFAIAAGSMVMNVVNSAIVAGLYGLERMGRPALWGIVRAYTGGLLCLYVMSNGGGVVAFVFVFNVVAIIPLTANYLTMRPMLKSGWTIDLGLWRRMLAGGFPFLVSSALLLTSGKIDIPILQRFAGSEAVGWYALAYQWVAMPAFFAASVAQAFFPTMSAQSASTPEDFTRTANRALRLVAFVATPAGVGVALVASSLVTMLYDAEFQPTVVLMQILAIHIPIVAIDIVLGSVLVAADRQRQWMFIGVGAAVFNPIMNLVAIPLAESLFGNAAIGAAVTTVLTEGLLLVGFLALRPAGVLDRPTTSFVLRTAVASVTMVPVVVVLGGAPVVVLIVAGATTYGLACLAFRTVSVREVRGWRERLRRRQPGRGSDRRGDMKRRTALAAHGDERARYHKDVPTLHVDHPWHRIHSRIRPGATVLDVGCGSGGLGQLLSQTAADVDGIELNEERAAEARQYLRTVVTDEGGPMADTSLRGPYDVVIFADVLEHIVEPAETLRWGASKLGPDGKILALIPNSANWKFRRKVLKGDWSYADTGYFDRDHVRFFDVATARALGAEVGLAETAIEYVPERLPKPLDKWSSGALFAAQHRPNLFAGHVLIEWQALR